MLGKLLRSERNHRVTNHMSPKSRRLIANVPSEERIQKARDFALSMQPATGGEAMDDDDADRMYLEILVQETRDIDFEDLG